MAILASPNLTEFDFIHDFIFPYDLRYFPAKIYSLFLLCTLTLPFVQSELTRWLPSVSCIYYVGHKDQRAKIFSQVGFLSEYLAPILVAISDFSLVSIDP